LAKLAGVEQLVYKPQNSPTILSQGTATITINYNNTN
jgi:hypothetical protein